MAELPEVTIVMPAYNAAHFVTRTIPAAIAAARGGRVLLVDPGSTDRTGEVAAALGAEVVRLPERAGPAHARNVGVSHVQSEVVLFIDSDCVAHPDVVDRVRAAFAADPELVSLTGSYDSTPPEQNFFSQYMNLRHHVTHQRANTENAGFWAGCGAVRREAFVKVNGFDAARFPMPMIEDIDLGLRLSPLGRCKLDPQLHVTHLKLWTMRGVIETDIKSRAIPWAKLILDTGKLPNDLNLRISQRIAAALSPLVLLAVPGIPLALLFGMLGGSHAQDAWLIALSLSVPVLVSAAIFSDMLRSLAAIRGPFFALQYFLFHQVHLFYSATTFAMLSLVHKLAHKAKPASSET